MRNNVEVLSPAGNKKAFIAALNAGADAIYMGVGKYNARAMAENFTIEEYCECIKEAHKREVKVYLTLNTLVKNNEIREALNLVAILYSKGLDAVILQDLGLAMKIHELFPKLNIHASTQMSVYSLEQVNFLKSLGFSRVVLARELSVQEIENICKATGVEVEVFVHGALCVSFSGQCNMSRLIGEKSANRGTCAQTCRMRYSLYKDGEKRPIIQDKYILSKKDIWGLDYVERLVKAGVKSLKIEGRNKGPEYVAQATKVYKDRINGSVDDKEKADLLQVFNRSGKSEGYLNGVRFKDSISLDTPKNVGVILGKVLDVNKKYIKVKLENDIDLHDGIEINSNLGAASTIVTCIRNNKFDIVNKKVQSGNVVWLGDINSKCNVGDVVYKTSDSKLNEELNIIYATKIIRQKDYDLYVEIKKNEKVYVVARNENTKTELLSEIVPEDSIKKSVTEEDVVNAFSKTEESSVRFKNYNIKVDSNLFLPISKLNELRRKLIEKTENSFDINLDVTKEQELIDNLTFGKEEDKRNSKYNSLYIYSYDKNKNYIKEYEAKYNKKLDRLYIVANDFAIYSKDIIEKYKNIELFFVIPNVTLNKLQKYIETNLEALVKEGVKGILVGNLQYMNLVNELKKQYGLIIGADYSLNITNILTIDTLKKLGFDFFTLSFELNEQDIEQIADKYNVELVENLATAMTSRYCLIGSFAEQRKKDVCSRPCTRDNYYLVDGHNKKYDIVCDNFDCVMRLIRNKYRYSEDIKSKSNIRNCWLS
ncbi:MAG: U32 family peptidase [Clostridia bacterium]|nr:U32 family peptidase [Clostridia bacterium]